MESIPLASATEDARGTALVLLGTFLAALAYVLQKSAHASAQGPAVENSDRLLRAAPAPPAIAPPPPLHSRPVWLCGILCMLLSGAAITASSLDQTKQAALGAATLIFNAALATLLLRERFLVLHALSTLVIMCGVAISVRANHELSRSFTFPAILALLDYTSLFFSAAAAAGLCACHAWLARVGGAPPPWRPWVRSLYSVLAPAAGGLCNGLCGAALKALATAAQSGELVSAAVSAPFWGLILLVALTASAQVHFLNAGLALFTASRIVPVFQCSVIVCNALCGIVYFHDMRAHPLQLAWFFVGALVCVGGVLLLLLQRDEEEALAAREKDAAAGPAGPWYLRTLWPLQG